MALRAPTQTLLRRASLSLRTLSQTAQARSAPFSTPPPHRQSLRWRPSPPPSFRTPTTEAHNSARTHSDPRTRLLLSYHDLERALEKRGLKSVRVLIAGAGGLAIAVALAWPRIKKWGAAEGAEVAAASLEQERLQERAAVMVHEVLSDPRTGEQVEQLLKAAVLNLFQDEEFTEKAVDWTSRVMGEALTWDTVKQKGTEYLESVFADNISKQSAQLYLSEAVSNVAADEQVQDTVATNLWAGVRASILGRRHRNAAGREAPVTQSMAQAHATNSQQTSVNTDRAPSSTPAPGRYEADAPVQAASLANGIQKPEDSEQYEARRRKR